MFEPKILVEVIGENGIKIRKPFPIIEKTVEIENLFPS